MNLTFATDHLAKLASGENVRSKLAAAVVRAYRARIAQVIAAEDERDLRADYGAHFELLKADRAGQYSMRLNSQFRVVFQIRKGTPKNTIHILEICDYH